jgi:hypothetical protein
MMELRTSDPRAAGRLQAAGRSCPWEDYHSDPLRSTGMARSLWESRVREGPRLLRI